MFSPFTNMLEAEMVISQEHFCFLHQSDTSRQMWGDSVCAVLKTSTGFLSFHYRKVEVFHDGLVCRSSDISVLIFIMNFLGALRVSLCPSALFQSRLHTSTLVTYNRAKRLHFKCKFIGMRVLPCIDTFQKPNQDTLGSGSSRGTKCTRNWEGKSKKSHQFQHFAG